MREHLVATNGYDAPRAEAVADEILAVNAETVGLIVEKGPTDIGFVHASLEEYLCAVHIHSWRFEDLIDFAGHHAGDPRWRNVLRNVVALNTRANEISEIVDAIEASELDVLGAINRNRLLAEITFAPSKMNAATAHRLANQTFAIIEGNGPEALRFALLRPVLNGLGDPVLDDAIQTKIKAWAPRRLEYSQSLYRTLRLWAPDDLLLRTLLAGLKDRNRDGARTAAQILATKFSGRDAVGGDLGDAIHGNADLEFVAAALEALVIGWPGERTDAMVAKARESRSPLLRAVAIWARTRSQRQDDRDLKECLQMVSFRSPLDIFDRSIASEALFAGWPNDDRVVTVALRAEQRGAPLADTLDRDLAVTYLLRSSPGRPDVEQWILTNLGETHPFISTGGGDRSDLVAHCEASPAIHEKLVAHILSGAQKYNERQIYPLIARLKDTRLRDHAIAEMVGDPNRFGHYWTLLPLVEGWASDPQVQTVFDRVIALDDADMSMLADLLPRLYKDPVQARARLVRIARDAPMARYDLIAGALAELGIDGRDDEAVEALLPHATSPSPLIGNADIIFALFAQCPKVQAAALVRLTQHEPPIGTIAHGMAEHPAVRAYVADLVQAAPDALRSSIVAACGTSGDRHQVLFDLLANYDDETDFSLRIQLAIDFYRLKRARGENDGLVDRLLVEADRTGPNYEEHRTIAFAGLLVLGQANVLLNRASSDRDILLGSRFHGRVSSALCGLVAEHWDELKTAFGEDFITRRLKAPDGAAWSQLSRYVGGKASARRDFLEWCEQTTEVDGPTIAALAEIAPRSDLLLRHLFATIDRSISADDRQIPDLLTSARILADQFPGQPTVDRVRALFVDHPMVAVALVLAFLSPNDAALKNRRMTALELGETHGGWVGAVEMAARMEPADMVVAVIHRLSERPVHPRWDQGLPLEALIDRISRDPEARRQLRNSLETELSPDAFCAAAVILAGSGALDASGWDLCMARLAAEQAVTNIPTAALDIATDQVRPVAHILSDLFQTRSSL